MNVIDHERVWETVMRLMLVLFVAVLPVSIAATQVSLFLLWLCWISWSLARRRWEVWRIPIDIAVAAFFIACLLATACSSHFIESASGLKKFYLTSAAFVIPFAVQSKEEWKRLLDVFILSAVTAAIWGFIDVKGIPHVTLSFRTMRLTVSGILMMAGVLAFALLFQSSVPVIVRWGRRAIAIVLPVMLVLTHQVSSLAAFVIGCCFVAGARRKWTVVAALSVMTICGITVVALRRPDPTGMQYDYRGNKTWSWFVRKTIWQTGWEVIKDRPIIGYGLIGIGEYYQQKKAAMPVVAGDDRRTFGHLHNTALQVWATTGIVGLCAFVVLIASILRQSIRTLKMSSDDIKPYMIGIVSAQIGFLVNGLAEYNFGDSEVVTIFWVLTGFSLALQHLMTNKQSTARADRCGS